MSISNHRTLCVLRHTGFNVSAADDLRKSIDSLRILPLTGLQDQKAMQNIYKNPIYRDRIYYTAMEISSICKIERNSIKVMDDTLYMLQYEMRREKSSF